MGTLQQINKKINNQFFNTVNIPHKQPFYYFIGTHPHLYDGLDIDGLTINCINNYFYEWLVNPLHFEHRYVNILQLELSRYNNLKNIEMSHQILELFTTKSSKVILNDAIKDFRNIKENKQKTKNKNTSKTTTKNTNTTKDANKELPMNASGNTFETIVDWKGGASDISQNESINDGTSDLNATNTIKTEDKQKMANLEKAINSGTESYKEIKGQAVLLVENITKYLIQPKSIEYLIDKLREAFIKVY